MTCCNRECLTPFCPHCGRRSEDPLVELLAHVRDHQGSQATVLEEYRREFDQIREPRPRDERKLERLTALAAKWERWGKALEEAIAKQGASA